MPTLILSTALAIGAQSESVPPINAPAARRTKRLVNDMMYLLESAVSAAGPTGPKGPFATSVPPKFAAFGCLGAAEPGVGAKEMFSGRSRRARGALGLGSTIADARLRGDNPRRRRIALGLGAQLAHEDPQVLSILGVRRTPDRG